MPATTDIVATWTGPGKVIRRHLARGESEPRALAFLMGACTLIFVAQWPRLAREAYLSQTELNPLLGASLMAWIFLAPLLLYGLALLTHGVARLLGGQGSAWGSRLALFWALLAATPLMLLDGLVAGFIGNGTARQLVGMLWLLVFCWFWIRGLMVVHEAPEDAGAGA